MKFFEKLFKKPQSRIDETGYWVYVQCDRCGEIIRSRIDLFNDLSADYESSLDEFGEARYFCRKTLIGSKRCFLPIEIELTFNQKRELIHRQIEGGVFVSEAEYLATQEASA